MIPNPICDQAVEGLSAEDFLYYDKDGFELNLAEQKYYRAMNHPIQHPILNHTCWQEPWFSLQDEHPSLSLDHSMFLCRTSYTGAAREQLNELKSSIPQADYLLKTKQKWGFDIALDAQAPSGDMDSHFIRSDEYFAATRPVKGGGASDVLIARMLQPASDATKGEAQFMDSHKGTEFWTRTFWKTRPATQEDLKLGATVIYWGRYAKDRVYYAPRNEKEARNVPWKLNKITDVSDLFKGEVTVAGNKKVSVDSIRIME